MDIQSLSSLNLGENENTLRWPWDSLPYFLKYLPVSNCCQTRDLAALNLQHFYKAGKTNKVLTATKTRTWRTKTLEFKKLQRISQYSSLFFLLIHFPNPMLCRIKDFKAEKPFLLRNFPSRHLFSWIYYFKVQIQYCQNLVYLWVCFY